MSHDKIHKICKEYSIKNYTINDDGTIDVDEGVYLFYENLTELPLKFNKVSGYFNCAFNNLISLKGAPKEVGGNFRCNNNNLTTLKGAPLKVGGNFYCHNNKLKSLKGAPLEIGGRFHIRNNPVKLDYNKYLKGVKRMNKLKEL